MGHDHHHDHNHTPAGAANVLESAEEAVLEGLKIVSGPSKQGLHANERDFEKLEGAVVAKIRSIVKAAPKDLADTAKLEGIFEWRQALNILRAIRNERIGKRQDGCANNLVMLQQLFEEVVKPTIKGRLAKRGEEALREFHDILLKGNVPVNLASALKHGEHTPLEALIVVRERFAALDQNLAKAHQFEHIIEHMTESGKEAGKAAYKRIANVVSGIEHHFEHLLENEKELETYPGGKAAAIADREKILSDLITEVIEANEKKQSLDQVAEHLVDRMYEYKIPVVEEFTRNPKKTSWLAEYRGQLADGIGKAGFLGKTVRFASGVFSVGVIGHGGLNVKRGLVGYDNPETGEHEKGSISNLVVGLGEMGVGMLMLQRSLTPQWKPFSRARNADHHHDGHGHDHHHHN